MAKTFFRSCGGTRRHSKLQTLLAMRRSREGELANEEARMAVLTDTIIGHSQRISSLTRLKTVLEHERDLCSETISRLNAEAADLDMRIAAFEDDEEEGQTEGEGGEA